MVRTESMAAPATAALAAMTTQSGRSGARFQGDTSSGASIQAQGMARKAAVAGATWATAATGPRGAPRCCSSACGGLRQRSWGDCRCGVDLESCADYQMRCCCWAVIVIDK